MDAKAYAILILETHRFLARRSRDAAVLSRRDRQLLDSAIAFLSHVLDGQALLSQHYALVPNVDSLSAYSFAASALHASQDEARGEARESQDELFQTALGVLRRLRQGTPLENIESVELERTRWLFARLVQFAFEAVQSGAWPATEELFVLAVRTD